MSVQQNHYFIVGAKFGYDEFYEFISKAKGKDPEIFRDEEEEKYQDSAFGGIHHHNNLCIMSDGMNGEFVYVGHVIKKSDNYGGLDDNINDEPTPNPDTVRERIIHEFGLDVECSFHAFTYYR